MKINYGFCKSATIKEVKENDYALTPGKYVGTPEEEGDGIPFEEKMQKLATELSEQLKEKALNKELKKVLGAIGLIHRVNYEPNYAIKNMGFFKIKDEHKSKW